MKNKGFSLVELIVVIAIMAILVGVAVPVYSSYIEKANKAKDEQLLGEINSAFAVVCAGNAIDINTVTDANIDVEDGAVKLSTMVVKVGSTEIAGFAEAMVGILGNDLEFAVIEDIWYNKDAHKFEENVVREFAYGGGKVYLSAEDIAKLKASNFAALGMSELLGKVDDAVGMVNGLDSSSSLYTLIYDDSDEMFGISAGTKQSIAKLLGFDEWDLDNTEFSDALEALMLKKGVDINEASDAEIKNAMKEIGANAAVFSAATNSNIDTNQFAASLANGTAISDIKNAQGNEQLGQIAVAYAMYTSYVTEYNKTAEAGKEKEVSTDVSTVLSTLKADAEFKAYMQTEQAVADMDGYLAAMNMVNDSSKDTTAASTLLVNGFTDAELAALLNGVVEN